MLFFEIKSQSQQRKKQCQRHINTDQYIYYFMGCCLQHLLPHRKAKSQLSKSVVMQQLLSKLCIHQMTQNSGNFIYYQNYYELDRLLEDVLKAYENSQNNRKTLDFVIDEYQEKVKRQQQSLQKYLNDLNNEKSQLYQNIKHIQDKIILESNQYCSKQNKVQQMCMVKFQIQELTLNPLISQISISIISHSPNNTNKVDKILQTIQLQPIITHINEQLFKKDIFKYYQIIAPVSSKITISSSPLQSSVTIDIQDVNKTMIMFSILPMKRNLKIVGAVSLKAQCIGIGEGQKRKIIQLLGLKKLQLNKLLEGKGQGLEGLFSEPYGSNSQKKKSLMSYYDNPYYT